jgi:ribosomal-protein-alanine N-acetyltransferase
MIRLRRVTNPQSAIRNPQSAMPSLRLLELTDASALADYYLRNQEFHRIWSPVPPPGFFTELHQRERLFASLQLRDRGQEFRFGIFDDVGLLVGTISLTAIERGVFQNGRFGYSIDGDHQRKGVMTAKLREAMTFGFNEQKLHRLEANIMPHNEASRRVLQKCGFTKIGYSPKYLKINGRWEDHEMYMILVDDFDGV